MRADESAVEKPGRGRSAAPARGEAAGADPEAPASAGRGFPMIEFKGTSVSAIAVMLGEAALERLDAAVVGKLGSASDFFEGEPALIDLSRLRTGEEGEDRAIDLDGVVALLRQIGLSPIGVRALPPALADRAARLGLSLMPAPRSSPDEGEAAPDSATPAKPDEMPDETPEVATALLVERPLRSGQRVYARGRDLVIAAAINPGAEVIADGSIHCYGALRGRALAGASGDTSACIYATSFQAELVSIAGAYRTFETIPADKIRRPVRVRLRDENGEPRIALEIIDTT